jgi:hypothetical protein
MARKFSRFKSHVLDTVLFLMLAGVVLSQFRRGVHAAEERTVAIGNELESEDFINPRPRPRASPSPVPSPSVTPRPRPTAAPVPLPVVLTDEKIWVAQGELYSIQNSYVCRAACRKAWEGKSFEVLQATRGTEDWSPQQDLFVRCRNDFEISYLSGGLWHTPPDTPESSLCFLVIRQFSEASEH